MEIVIVNVLKSLLLPPGLSVTLALLALLAVWRWRGFARACVILALASLALFSLPVVANLLSATLEPEEIVTPETELGDYWQAIVVLGGGIAGQVSEYGEEIPTARSLERLRFAARLHRQSGLPLVISGGRVFGEGASEAQLLDGVLERDFGLKARWLETESRNTAENARFTRTLLAAHRIERVLLVTHANHIRRAAQAFKAQGLAVLPAPTLVGAPGGNASDGPWRDWLPAAWALSASRDALHEHAGYLWYRLRY